jgi:hypothetical protein
VQVACYIRIGATTGSIDRSNYLCILSNNLFNQAGHGANMKLLFWQINQPFEIVKFSSR